MAEPSESGKGLSGPACRCQVATSRDASTVYPSKLQDGCGGRSGSPRDAIDFH